MIAHDSYAGSAWKLKSNQIWRYVSSLAPIDFLSYLHTFKLDFNIVHLGMEGDGASHSNSCYEPYHLQTREKTKENKHFILAIFSNENTSG